MTRPWSTLLPMWIARWRRGAGGAEPPPGAPPSRPADEQRTSAPAPTPWAGPERRHARTVGRLVGVDPDEGIVVWLERPVRPDGRRLMDRLLHPTAPRRGPRDAPAPPAPVTNLVTVAWADLDGPVQSDQSASADDLRRHLQYHRVEIFQPTPLQPRLRIHALG